MRAFALLSALVLLAGCADNGGNGDENDDGDSSGTVSGTASGSGTRTGSGTGTRTGSATATGTGSPANNTAPTANLTADVDNGTAPLVVNFTLNGADADGDALRWTFDADADGTPEANGTSLPATVQHTFNATGQFRATLNVTDGTGNVSAVRLIAVAEGAGGASLIDRGEYFWEPSTGMCHAKEYEEEAPGVYLSEYGGGTWVIVEANDVDGLQLESNHPLKDVPDSGANMPLPDPCTSGDQIVF